MDSNTNWLKRVSSIFKKTDNTQVKKQAEVSNIKYDMLYAVSFNGEKNLGEMGMPKNYLPEYSILRIRSWQAYLESEIAQIVIGKYATWLIGSGLKLQSEPPKKLLESEGITLDAHAFSQLSEGRFNLYRKSQSSDYSGMDNLDSLAVTALINAINGGDVLVILRYVENTVKIQLIDGDHVKSPLYGTEWYPQDLPNGNKLINGIEMDVRGKHIAYYVATANLKYERIEAIGKQSGLQTAFLVYGLKYRLNNVRGIPLLSVVLETIKKLERYKEATLGSAEERQKIAFSIEHDITSTGENPFAKNMAKAYNADAANDEIPKDLSGQPLADKVAATTNKQVVNMPGGAKLNLLESKNELYFKDFYTVNIDLVCAAMAIPPNVAMSKYDSNYSSSRAAIKDWENTLKVKRESFAFQFYQKIYNFWLEVQILQNKLQAPGYMQAKLSNNSMVIEAYRTARFVGPSVPHIDPMKEVQAERLKLGDAGASIPLTTVEAATETLSSGESRANMEQFAEELEESIELDIVAPAQPNGNTKNTNNNTDDENKDDEEGGKPKPKDD